MSFSRSVFLLIILFKVFIMFTTSIAAFLYRDDIGRQQNITVKKGSSWLLCLCFLSNILCSSSLGLRIPSSACGCGERTAVSQTMLEPDYGWSLETSFVWQHPTRYDFPRLFLLSLKFICLVFGGIYGNSFWSFTSYRIMWPLCVKLNQDFLEFVRLLRCIGHCVLQFLFLKYDFYQTSLWFLSETEKGEGDSCLTLLCHSPINMSVFRCSDSKAPWQASAVTVITEAMLLVLC